METEKYYDPDWRDRLFQRWHGVDVEGILPVAAIASAELAATARGTFYQPIPVRYLKRILKSAKACLYMGRTGAFRRVVGVEISSPLISIARDNRIQMGGTSQVEFVQADAQTYLLPDGPTLVFLFNPFDAIAMSRFISFNRRHFQRHGSIIAYAFDIDREVLKNHGFKVLWRDNKNRLSFHAIS